MTMERTYACRECGLKYKNRKWVEKCENFCKRHKQCSLEIIKHTIRK